MPAPRPEHSLAKVPIREKLNVDGPTIRWMSVRVDEQFRLFDYAAINLKSSDDGHFYL
jgi:hypothetical protein